MNYRTEMLTKELSQQIPELKLEKELVNVSAQLVAKTLPKDMALIELVRFNIFDFHAIPAKGKSR
jgi:hypothetical protein